MINILVVEMYKKSEHYFVMLPCKGMNTARECVHVEHVPRDTIYVSVKYRLSLILTPKKHSSSWTPMPSLCIYIYI